jgi:hypothetical protein
VPTPENNFGAHAKNMHVHGGDLSEKRKKKQHSKKNSDKDINLIQ